MCLCGAIMLGLPWFPRVAAERPQGWGGEAGATAAQRAQAEQCPVLALGSEILPLPESQAVVPKKLQGLVGRRLL